MSSNTRGKIPTVEGVPQLNIGSTTSTSRQKKVFSSPDSPVISIGSPLYESFNKIGIQDDPPDYSKKIDASEPSKKNGTSCVVTASTHGKNKVMAPRSEDFPLKLPEKDLSDTSDLHLTTNVTVNLLDEMAAHYGDNPPFGSRVEFRVPESESVWNEQFQVPQSQSMFSESQSSGTQAFPTAGQTFIGKLFVEHKELTDQDGCFPDDFSNANAPAVGYKVEKASQWQVLQEDPKVIDIDTELSEYLMGCNTGAGAGQEVTCGDLIFNMPQDTYILNDIIYGTDKAVEELATNHGNELLKSGVHGVYSDPKFEVLKLDCQDSPSIYSELLGRGTFGVAIKCIVSKDFVFVIKKVTQKFHPEEVMFTHNNTHPNIIKSYALVLRHGTPEIIMEYAGRSLLSLVNEKKLPESTIWSLSWELCCGLAFLDTKNVIHFDIKPENIFIMEDGDGGYFLKIGDFGSARMPGGPIEMSAWTPEYLAPEMGQLFLRKTVNAKILKIQKTEQEIEDTLQPKTDMFPAGLVVGFMFTGEHLLLSYIRRTKPNVKDQNQQRLAVIGHVSHQENLGEMLIPASAGPEMKAVLKGMLQFDVTKRSSAEETRNLMTGLSAKRNYVTYSTTQMDVKPQPVKVPVNSEGGDSMEKRIIPKKSKTRTRQSRPKNELKPVGSQMTKPSSKVEEIMSENKQLRKRMVRNELKRKLEIRSPRPAAKVMRTAEANRESMELGYCGSSEGNQCEVSEESERGFGEAYVPLEQPFPEIRISEHQHPICQAEDDWSIQETTPGNIPDFGCLGID